MVYYCFCMFYRLKKRVPMLTANMYVVLGMLTWPKIIIDGWWTLALVCFNTYKKNSSHAQWTHICIAWCGFLT